MSARFRIEVIDLLKNPALARDHQILAIPTLVRSLPVPIRKIIGDLSDTERVIEGLDTRASESNPPPSQEKGILMQGIGQSRRRDPTVGRMSFGHRREKTNEP